MAHPSGGLQYADGPKVSLFVQNNKYFGAKFRDGVPKAPTRIRRLEVKRPTAERIPADCFLQAFLRRKSPPKGRDFVERKTGLEPATLSLGS